MGDVLYLAAKLLHLYGVLRVGSVKGCLADGEAELHLSAAVAQLLLGLRQEARVRELLRSERIVEPAERIDGSAGDDGGVAIEDVRIVLDGHIDVARILVLDVVYVYRVAISDNVVGAALLTHGRALHGDVACERVAAYGVVHVEVVESVLRAVILLSVVNHRAHEGELATRDVVEDGLHHEARVLTEHLARHSHTGGDMQIVALDVDVGGLGHNLVRDALGLYEHFVERHVALLKLYVDVGLAVLQLYGLRIESHHAEAEGGTGEYVEGELAVSICDGVCTLGGNI